MIDVALLSVLSSFRKLPFSTLTILLTTVEGLDFDEDEFTEKVVGEVGDCWLDCNNDITRQSDRSGRGDGVVERGQDTGDGVGKMRPLEFEADNDDGL